MGSIMVEGEISIPQVEVPADTPMTETTPEVSESANEIKAADEAEAKKEDGTDKNEKKDDSSDDEDKEPEGPVGHSAETKNLYAKYDKDQNRSWSDKIPEDLESAAENESTRKYALIARMKKPVEADSSKPLVLDSIIVQSPFLKRVLSKVLEGYQGIVTDVTRLVLYSPEECFVHRWDALAAARADPSHDDITKEHLELLCNLLQEELGDTIQVRADAHRTQAVAWKNVWTLFPPGSTVLGSYKGKQIAMRFVSGSYINTNCGKVYSMDCEYIDWDGTRLGWADINQRIPEYDGTMPFSSLRVTPLEFHPQVDAVKAALIARGQRFQSLAGYHYKAYNGQAIYYHELPNGQTKARREPVNCRIVVDGATWERENYDNTVYLSSLHRDNVKGGSGQCGGDASSDDNCYSDSDLVILGDDDEVVPRLSEEQLLMTGPVVRGYALKNKRWMEFYIDSIDEIQFDEGAFDSLVVNPEQKELILAFTQSQVSHKNSFDDVISGKGRGIIMLLSGGPGIGKTLTAESVAEQMRVPLYIMSAGDLGTDVSDVEDNLRQVTSMAASWNAVLLLDECDVFLEARSTHDMERNRIVSVFLRTLEYYEGILFLTTNRIDNIDTAFQSRIHMSLEYPPLDPAARASIWRGFLSRSVKPSGAVGMASHTITDAEILQVSKLNLNGRQIKNVLKMANLLAHQKGEALAFRHLKMVLTVEGHSL
jgi:hypothetical protein